MDICVECGLYTEVLIETNYGLVCKDCYEEIINEYEEYNEVSH